MATYGINVVATAPGTKVASYDKNRTTLAIVNLGTVRAYWVRAGTPDVNEGFVIEPNGGGFIFAWEKGSDPTLPFYAISSSGTINFRVHTEVKG